MEYSVKYDDFCRDALFVEEFLSEDVVAQCTEYVVLCSRLVRKE